MRPSANSRTPSVFRKTGLLVLLSGVALLFLTHSAQAQDATGGVNPLGLSMSREHPPSFEPGQTLEVVVVVQAAGSGQLLAMGLRETIPSGWSMESVGGLSGAPPDIAPGPGTQGRLEFAWVTPPDRFPYSFSYTLLPPEDAGGAGRHCLGESPNRPLGEPRHDHAPLGIAGIAAARRTLACTGAGYQCGLAEAPGARHRALSTRHDA